MSISLSGSLLLTGSIVASGNLTTTGTITAQTLVVQTITSSIVNITGSNIFGSQLSDRQTFTGSLFITGSANLRGAFNVVGPSPATSVSSSGAGAIIEFKNNAATAYLGIDNLGAYLVPTARGTAIYDGSGTQYLYVTSSGIGIGTTTPTEKLQVNGSIKLDDGSADGPQLKLASSGYSDWNIDNYNGALRAYYGANVALSISSNLSARFSKEIYLNSASGLAGEQGFLFFNNSPSNASSRNWKISNDQNDWGDLAIQYSSTQTGATSNTAIQISSAGNVGIGTTSTTKKLQVSAAVANEVVQFSNTRNNGSGDYAFVTTLGSSDNNTSNYHYIAATGGADKYYLYGNGTYTTVSDQRLKKNITTVTDTYLDKVNSLRIVNYNWNDQPDGHELELGMIAQEVEAIIPSIIYEGREHEDGLKYKGIQVSSLPYILVKAIQEQNEIIEELKSRIEQLENK